MQPEYMTKQANDDLIVITRKKLIELMNLQCRMRYMLTLLGAICCKKKLEFMMMPQDVCDFLKIDYKTFEKTLSKVAPKCTFWQGGKVYTLEQMVNVAEIATRPQRLKKILPPDQMTQRRQPHGFGAAAAFIRGPELYAPPAFQVFADDLPDAIAGDQGFPVLCGRVLRQKFAALQRQFARKDLQGDFRQLDMSAFRLRIIALHPDFRF